MRYLVQLVLIGLILYLVMIVISTLRKEGKKPSPPRGEIEEIKLDPVCRTYIPESQAVVLEDGGEKVYFCSEKCRKEYKEKTKKEEKNESKK